MAWVESVLGVGVVHQKVLTGGMTSTMLALSDESGGRSVLRLMTREPWRTHESALTTRERAAFAALGSTPVPAPTSFGLDADGIATAAAAHLMSVVPRHPNRCCRQHVGACDGRTARHHP